MKCCCFFSSLEFIYLYVQRGEIYWILVFFLGTISNMHLKKSFFKTRKIYDIRSKNDFPKKKLRLNQAGQPMKYKWFRIIYLQGKKQFTTLFRFCFDCNRKKKCSYARVINEPEVYVMNMRRRIPLIWQTQTSIHFYISLLHAHLNGLYSPHTRLLGKRNELRNFPHIHTLTLYSASSSGRTNAYDCEFVGIL